MDTDYEFDNVTGKNDFGTKLEISALFPGDKLSFQSFLEKSVCVN